MKVYEEAITANKGLYEERSLRHESNITVYYVPDTKHEWTIGE